MKLCEMILCSQLKIPTVLLTTGVSGRKDLCCKMNQLLGDLTAEQGRPEILDSADIRARSTSRDIAVRALAERGACVVFNNTGAAIDKARSLIREARGLKPSLRWNLVIDEADDFYRSDAGLPDAQESHMIRLEAALCQLQHEVPPAIEFDVTATLLSIFIRLKRLGQANLSHDGIFYIEASEEYVGTEALQPLRDANGTPVFLQPNELKKQNKYLSPSVWAMYDAAAAAPRSLLLDCTTSAVTAAGNTTEKANELLTKHPGVVAIVVSGGEIKWRHGCRNEWVRLSLAGMHLTRGPRAQFCPAGRPPTATTLLMPERPPVPRR